MVHKVVTALDELPSSGSASQDGDYHLDAKRKEEAHEVINNSDDEVFQTDLYDWYIDQGRADRLLQIQSPYIITYLQRRMLEDLAIADLLWRYHSQAHRPHDAAAVQLQLAKSDYTLTLDQRIEYLSRAKANASSYSSGLGRQNRQKLLREVSDLLDVANIQHDLLQKLGDDRRIPADRKVEVLGELNGVILPLDTVSKFSFSPSDISNVFE